MTTTGEATVLPGSEAEPQTAPATTLVPEKVERPDTSYLILSLRRDATPGTEPFFVIASDGVTARSAEAAVKVYADTIPSELWNEDGETLVAIPSRSWKPMKVRPKVETTLVIKDA